MKILIQLFLLLISIPVRSEIELKNGDIYTLDSYPENNSVYIKIEAQSDHPVLEAVFVITYHGICIKHENAFNKTIRRLHPSILSKSALIDSIDIKRNPEIDENLYCPGTEHYKNYVLSDNQFNEMLNLNNDIEISPLDKRLSTYEESGNFKLVTK